MARQVVDVKGLGPPVRLAAPAEVAVGVGSRDVVALNGLRRPAKRGRS